MPSANARGQGIRFADAVVRKFGLEHVGESREAIDFRAANGTGYGAKSAVYRRADGRPGVFRFNKDHLKELREKTHQSGQILGLMPSVGSSSSTPLKIETVSTERVFEIVDGRWYPETREYEVPWPDLLDYSP
jgi:hypothetical protein